VIGNTLASEDKAARQSRHPNALPVRLLVAEADENACEALLGTLRNAAFTLRAQYVEDARGLREALQRQAWDMLLLHRASPLGELRDVVALVREFDAALPILLLDPMADAGAEHAIDDGVDAGTGMGAFTAALRDGATDVLPDDDRERLLLVFRREWENVRERARLARAQSAFDEIEHRIQLLLSTAEVGIAYVLDGMHVFANDAYMRLFGYSDVEDLLGATMLDLVPVDEQDSLKAYLRAIGDGQREPLRLRCQHREGALFEADMTVESAVYDGEACWQVAMRPRASVASLAEVAAPADEAPAARDPLDLLQQDIESFHAGLLASGLPSCIGLLQWTDHAACRARLGLALCARVNLRVDELMREAFAAPHRILRVADDLTLVLLQDLSTEVARGELVDIANHIAERCARESHGAMKLTLATHVAPLADELSPDLSAVDDLLRGVGLLPAAPWVPDGPHAEDVAASSPAASSPAASSPASSLPAAASAPAAANPSANPSAMPAATPSASAHAAPAHLAPASVVDLERRKRLTPAEAERLHADVDRCLQENAFTLMFQPIISVRGDADELYEAFLYTPARGGRDAASVQPLSFAELARDTLPMALCTRVDRWLVLQAIKLLSTHRANGHDSRLVINLSGATVADASFPQWLGVAIRAARLPADALVFQLCEDDARHDVKQAAQFTSALAGLHCRTSVCHYLGLDDPRRFVQLLGIDFVKLDASLIDAVQTGGERKTTLARLIDVLQNAGKLTIVPMVESASLLSTLWTAGANYIQGHYLQEPSPEMDYVFTVEE
jgi:PAS domain S-box-containing protein